MKCRMFALSLALGALLCLAPSAAALEPQPEAPAPDTAAASQTDTPAAPAEEAAPDAAEPAGQALTEEVTKEVTVTVEVPILPEKPPITDWKSNALRKIDANMPGTFLMFRKMMSSETSTYRIPMNGTRISVMLARRFAPPSTITPNRNARMTPMNAGVITGW